MMHPYTALFWSLFQAFYFDTESQSHVTESSQQQQQQQAGDTRLDSEGGTVEG
jgi:hypothetical protein